MLLCVIIQKMNQWKDSGHKCMQTQQLCYPNFSLLATQKSFLSNPAIVDFLTLCQEFFIISDFNLPKNLWQITFGEELHPNIKTMYTSKQRILDDVAFLFPVSVSSRSTLRAIMCSSGFNFFSPSSAVSSSLWLWSLC